MASRKTKLFLTIGGFSIAIILAVTLGLVLGLDPGSENLAGRTFSVDYGGKQFILNGEPFQYVSGSFHYFRALPHVWESRLRTMHAAGLNVVDTYVEWSFHQPFEGKFDFDGIADLERFLTLAQAEGLYVILRPGPYICAERDNGGIPYWLLRKYPDIKLRTSDPDYLYEVAKWYAQLMPRIQRFLYGNGGPIILVQVENEYGVSKLCDRNYLNWLRDETDKYVQSNAILFTVDIPNSVEEMQCGKIEGVLATTDFGIDKAPNMDNIWAMLREVEPDGPLVNSEFYPGWLTHWQEQNQRRDGDVIADALRKMLESGASVNFYMFFGGTNFGFSAGANDWGTGGYMADITSYDYDAVMDESGDPHPLKFEKIRNVIEEFITLSPSTPPIPEKQQKMKLNSMILEPIQALLSTFGRHHLGRPHVGLSGSSGGNAKLSHIPISFEEFDQFSGLILYECELPHLEIDPTLLTINKLADRAFIYIDDMYIGTLSRENAIKSLPINAGFGNKLQILVENQGRINFNIFDDRKGILGNVTIQKFDGSMEELFNWTITGFPLTNYDHFENLIAAINSTTRKDVSIYRKGILTEGPMIFFTQFTLTSDFEIHDTYFNPMGWGKGILFVNGFHLGRYWPLVGPQITMYIPKDILRTGVNRIVIVEYQKFPTDLMMHFTDTPQLDGL